MLILRLDKAGQPKSWVTKEEAAILYTRNQVLWELGNHKEVLYGGHNIHGQTSTLELASIIACEGSVRNGFGKISLSNRLLFRRDKNTCLYCGTMFKACQLTRDHVIPKFQKGPDIWTNVVASCKRCNSFKGARTPEQAGMKLLAIPFEPNLYEHFYLRNKRILADQMDFLRSSFSKNFKNYS